MSGNPSFKSFLHQVSQTALGALNHQTYPFYKLVERLKLKPQGRYGPIFQTLFQLERASREGLAAFLSLVPRDMPDAEEHFSWAGLLVEPFPLRQQEGRFDLSLTMYDNGHRIFATWRYDSDLFDASTMQRMVGYFQTLLAGLVANPEQGIDDLPWLTDAERHQLLVEWNDTAADYPSEQCIHQLFEEHAKHTRMPWVCQYRLWTRRNGPHHCRASHADSLFYDF